MICIQPIKYQGRCRGHIRHLPSQRSKEIQVIAIARASRFTVLHGVRQHGSSLEFAAIAAGCETSNSRVSPGFSVSTAHIGDIDSSGKLEVAIIGLHTAMPGTNCEWPLRETSTDGAMDAGTPCWRLADEVAGLWNERQLVNFF
jgi:hypothetical protein